MEQLDENKLLEESKKICNMFIDNQKRSLVTFTEDSSIIYTPDENIEKFKLDIKNGNLYFPLIYFLENDLDENQIMWHIYYELSLYYDWKKQSKIYLNRGKDWVYEIDFMTKYILDKVKKEGLSEDKAYSEKVIYNYVKNDIIKMLYIFDKYFGFLRVLQLCPMYKEDYNFNKITKYMMENGKTIESISEMPKQKAFINSFLIYEIYKEIPFISNIESNPFEIKIFNMEILKFVQKEFIKMINNNEGIIQRDEFIKNFIYPVYKNLWMEEIDSIILYKSKDENTDGKMQNIDGLDNEYENQEESIELNEDDIKSILEDMIELENEKISNIKETLDGKLDLYAYGISQSDIKLYNYYVNKMSRERNQMKKFWEKLIGDSKREVNVKQGGQIKGKLDVDSFISYYPQFVESEKKGNYKNLEIFNRYILKPEIGKLPKKIEVSFIIDNSGSMNPLKIEAARKALAVTLLSLDDFNNYLKNNAQSLKENIDLSSETWFFGSGYYNIKKLNNKDFKDDTSDIIKSIVKLDASDGATDDGACLKEILNGISKTQEKNLKYNDEVKIIFEITDGASSFPGSTREAISKLLDKNVQIYAFQIGKTSESTEKIFNYIWNEGYRENHGVIIGEDIENLPKELLSMVKNTMTQIFNN